MRKICCCCLICLLVLGSFAQSNRKLDSLGNMLYQYSRVSGNIGGGKCNTTISFVNGPHQLAVSYRQEVFRSELTWTSVDRGETSKQPDIEIVTVNLAPNESISWKFTYRNKHPRKDGKTVVERSCFMLLSEDYVIDKQTLPEIVVQ